MTDQTRELAHELMRRGFVRREDVALIEAKSLILFLTTAKQSASTVGWRTDPMPPTEPRPLYWRSRLVSWFLTLGCRHPAGIVCPHRQLLYDRWYRGYTAGFAAATDHARAKADPFYPWPVIDETETSRATD